MKKTLEQWLSYLESNHPTEIDMGLDRVLTVAKRMDLLKPTPLVLLVAGTNGKGSTVTITTQALMNSGMTVGSYMSPHLHVYNERVRINNQMVSDELIVESFEAIESARDEISLTYFEVGTLSSLYIFKQQKLDACVLEIGLGGRLDAVNIVEADGAAVTSIGLDHQDWLGDDIAQIAFEKAGVYRRQKPAICGERDPAETLIKHAKTINAPLMLKGQEFDFEVFGDAWNWRGLDHKGETIEFNSLPLPSLPVENAATAIQLLLQVKPEITQAIIEKSLKEAQLDGRLQVFNKPFNGLMDVGHNPQAAKMLNHHLSVHPVSGKTYALLAMLQDKDALSVVKEMTQVDAWNLAGISGYRGQTSRKLQEKVSHQLKVAREFESVAQALDELQKIVTPEDRVVVFGSFITVAQAQSWLTKYLEAQ